MFFFFAFTRSGPSHYLLHFHFDDCVGVVPKKVILRPEIPSVGETCVVKWSDGKDYEATVKAVGKDCTRRGGGITVCVLLLLTLAIP